MWTAAFASQTDPLYRLHTVIFTTDLCPHIRIRISDVRQRHFSPRSAFSVSLKIFSFFFLHINCAEMNCLFRFQFRFHHLTYCCVFLVVAMATLIISQNDLHPVDLEVPQQDTIDIHTDQSKTVLLSETVTPITWSFSISNPTNTEIVLQYVSSSCACMNVARLDGESKIPTGAIVHISARSKILFVVTSKIGPIRGSQAQTVNFIDVGSQNVNHQVRQDIIVLPDILTTPEFLPVSSIESKDVRYCDKTFTVSTRSRSEDSLLLPPQLLPASEQESIIAVLPLDSPYTESGFWVRNWTVCVRITYPLSDFKNDYFSRIDISINGNSTTTVAIPISILQTRSLKVFPSRTLVFTPASKGMANSQTILISTPLPDHFKLISCRVSNPAFKVEYHANSLRRSHILTISIQQEFAKKSLIDCELQIESSFPHESPCIIFLCYTHKGDS